MIIYQAARENSNKSWQWFSIWSDEENLNVAFSCLAFFFFNYSISSPVWFAQILHFSALYGKYNMLYNTYMFHMETT